LTAAKRRVQVMEYKLLGASERQNGSVALSRDPERIAMDDELMGLARRVLDAMRPLERELLRRCYLQEESEAQIRAALGLTETQFRLSKSRAKTRFGTLVRESVKGKKRQKKPPARKADGRCTASPRPGCLGTPIAICNQRTFQALP
jgi:DNA-directed RNA polymerase specialized sigma24 family protein